MKRTLEFVDTTLRDAHQSTIATRMTIEEMLPMLETIDKVGYRALEVWGGATFDACLRYLNEDPWERLRTIKKHIKHTKLQMLLRGQNILGYKHYPDDVLELFIKKAVENGIDIIRIFDALNDVRNMEKSIQFTKKYGAHAQAALSYTISPVHTPEYYADLVDDLIKLGIDSLCIKDMAGLLTPKRAFDLVTSIKKHSDIKIEMHTHCTVGTGQLAYLAAMEAGADYFDTATAPLSGASSQPPVEAMYESFKEYEDVKLNLNPDLFVPIADYFEKVRENHADVDANIKHINIRVLTSQVPGGMLSNLINQLKEQNAIDRLKEVLDEIPIVRKDLGYPPLVTPTSQIVGVQAVLNVMMGRYKKITREVQAYLKGLYGRPPAQVNQEFLSRVIDPKEIVNKRPADSLEPMLEKTRNEAGHLAQSDEDILSLALFPDIAAKYLRERYFGEIKVDREIMKENEEFEGIYPVS